MKSSEELALSQGEDNDVDMDNVADMFINRAGKPHTFLSCLNLICASATPASTEEDDEEDDEEGVMYFVPRGIREPSKRLIFA